MGRQAGKTLTNRKARWALGVGGDHVGRSLSCEYFGPEPGLLTQEWKPNRQKVAGRHGNVRHFERVYSCSSVAYLPVSECEDDSCLGCSALMMEAVRTSETLVHFHETARRYMLESCHIREMPRLL
jgi:hypothetical protein